MRWTGEGIILSIHPFGESSLIVHLLTREHGRVAGLARGARSRRRPALVPGNLVLATWSARLDEQLGTLVCEPRMAHASHLLEDPLRLAALSSLCALARCFLAEREPVPAIHATSMALLTAMTENAAGWAGNYVRWELVLLRETGAGLDLARCALTGSTRGLAYVSPRSGRAATRQAGAPWADKLLRLPAFLREEADTTPEAVLEGLDLTGFVLRRHAGALGSRLPPARGRMVEAFRKSVAIASVEATP